MASRHWHKGMVVTSLIVVDDAGEARGDGASQQAIEHHYDLGRDFYRLWLDTRMVYSCALWLGDPDDDLDAAQIAKLAWHATSAQADKQQRVLDVGCGWGALVRYLVEERDVGQVTGLTLSSDQANSLPSPTAGSYGSKIGATTVPTTATTP